MSEDVGVPRRVQSHSVPRVQLLDQLLRGDVAIALLDEVAEHVGVVAAETGHRDRHPARLAEPVSGRPGTGEAHRVVV